VRLDFASVKNAAAALETFISQMPSLEKIVVTNETYESYSEQVHSLTSRLAIFFASLFTLYKNLYSDKLSFIVISIF
jgi:hypothetical protein